MDALVTRRRYHILRDRVSGPVDSAAADWYPRLYGWLVTPPFMGIHIPTDRPASVATDWCLCLHGWPIMPPLLGVYDFTAGLPSLPPTGVLTYTDPDPDMHNRIHVFQRLSPTLQEWISQNITTGLPSPAPTGVSSHIRRLIHRRQVFSPIRWVGHTAFDGHLRLHRTAASSATDWCLCLHGWPIMPPLMGVYVFTDRLPSPPQTGALAYTRLRLHHRLAFAAADWCLRLHGWPIMPPLLDVYIFTDLPPRITPTGAIVFTVGHIAATTNRHHHLQRKLPTSAADCWPTTHLLKDDLAVIIGCYTAIDWIIDIVIFINILSSLFGYAYSAAVGGQLRHHNWLSPLPPIVIIADCVCCRQLFSSFA
uniref:cysteine dioxygenase n=1 Tax=Oryza sativa subsp. japonica TaxID=39947 RepID=Q94GK8_ORYSJ|nr:hypothetical protein [Oryza sativa Japonica Group]